MAGGSCRCSPRSLHLCDWCAAMLERYEAQQGGVAVAPTVAPVLARVEGEYEAAQVNSKKNKREKSHSMLYYNDKATNRVAPYGERAPTLGCSALSLLPRDSSHREGELVSSVEIPLPFVLSPLSADCVLYQLVIPGDPGTKARPRFNGHAYTPRQTKEAQNFIAWVVRSTYPDCLPNRSHDLGVSVAFFTKTRQRRDIDNLIKLLLDACNGLLWGDDMQIIELASKVVRKDENPRTELLVYTIDNGRQITCKQCGNMIPERGPLASARKNAIFCSKACYDEAQRKGKYVYCFTCKSRLYRQNDTLSQERWFCSSECRKKAYAAEKICRYCKQSFQMSSSKMRGRSFCSPECRIAWHNQSRPASQKPGMCPTCGAPSGKRNGQAQQCYECYVRGVKKPLAQILHQEKLL